VVLRNNRLTIDSTTRQKLTTEEIEQLKLAETGSGKAIIAKIMESHTALDEKTVFSLAKYTLRKSKKYLRRFTVLPMDVPMLANYMLNEKDAARIMDLREEMLGLIASWSNVHSAGTPPLEQEPTGRWLVVDDTAGLIVALLAERMGILHEDRTKQDATDESTEVKNEQTDSRPDQDMDFVEQTSNQQDTRDNFIKVKDEHSDSNPDQDKDFADQTSNQQDTNSTTNTKTPSTRPNHTPPTPHNTITLLHTALQPNVSFLNYFSFDPNSSSATGTYTSPTHPLYNHLRTLTWLELLSPETSTSCIEPETVTPETLASWKSSKRGNYYRKRRRWERTHTTMLETRAGGFDGLVVATSMDPASVLRVTVPLLKGGAPVVVYSASVQPLVELVDVYSGPRKTAYLNALSDGTEISEDDFPVDPRLLLAPSLQTARAQEWQVLPGRTHPLMTGRGGSEGYLFTATRVLPAEGNVQARGRFAKKRKIETGAEAVIVGAKEER